MKKDEEKRITTTFSFYKEDIDSLKELSENMGLNKSEVLRYLIDQAKKNQTLRNQIVRENEIRLRSKMERYWEKYHRPLECTTDYETSVKIYTSYGKETKTASKETLDTVDQHLKIKALEGPYQEEMDWCIANNLPTITFQEWLHERNMA